MAATNLGSTTTTKITNFPLNAWYVAAWDYEVNRNPISRVICEKPIVLYRTEEGKPVALADACWHRLAPLSLGKTVGKDGLQCPYHGLVFNAAGRCISMPAQETINPSATVPSFPAIQKYRYVWVWLGDPALAREELIPNMFQMDHPEWAGDGKTIHADCNYQLIVDNLMDLTHEEFVHGSSIGQAELSESDFVTTHDKNTVTVTRWMKDIFPPPFWKKNLNDVFPGYEGKVDRWQIIHFEAPSTICIDVGVAKAGTGATEGDRSQGVNAFVMNTITPETARTSHYFWSIQRNYRLESQAITTQLREAVNGVFREDEVMLRAQQNAIDANPHYEFYNLNIDAGGMWVRKLLEKQLNAENRPGSVSSQG